MEATHDRDIQKLKEVTGVQDDDTAKLLLTSSNGNVEQAIDTHIKSVEIEEEHSAKKQKTNPEKEEKLDPKTAEKPEVKIESELKNYPIFSKNSETTIEERYRACMLLAGVGDAIGYRNGLWEFNKDGEDIYSEYFEMGGIEAIEVNPKHWKVSDDTVMHIATEEKDLDKIMKLMAKKYVNCEHDFDDRAPGNQTLIAIELLSTPKGKKGKKKGLNWDEIPFAPKAGGCGGSMRAMCIGLRFPGISNRKMLIQVALESGRITHNHPVAFFGAVVAALFTAYAIEGISVFHWGKKMFEDFGYVHKYVKEGRDYKEYRKTNYDYFEEEWKKYMKKRGLLAEEPCPIFPEQFGIKERDKFYKSVSFDGWGGSSGHDSVIIAYDALVGAVVHNSWEELILRSAIHGGDSDSTATIACAWWGALFGFYQVPEKNYKKLEYREKLESLAQNLCIYAGKT